LIVNREAAATTLLGKSFLSRKILGNGCTDNGDNFERCAHR
jgi:hypothetical protein